MAFVGILILEVGVVKINSKIGRLFDSRQNGSKLEHDKHSS